MVQGITEFSILYVDTYSSDSMRKTLPWTRSPAVQRALIEIYRRLRPGNPPPPRLPRISSIICSLSQPITIFPTLPSQDEPSPGHVNGHRRQNPAKGGYPFDCCHPGGTQGYPRVPWTRHRPSGKPAGPGGMANCLKTSTGSGLSGWSGHQGTHEHAGS